MEVVINLQEKGQIEAVALLALLKESETGRKIIINLPATFILQFVYFVNILENGIAYTVYNEIKNCMNCQKSNTANKDAMTFICLYIGLYWNLCRSQTGS